MEVTRRGFMKLAAGAAAATAVGFDVTPAQASIRELKIARTTEVRSICPYCAVGCGMIAHVLGSGARNTMARVTHIEGDADSPINAGTLCPKGASAMQLAVSRDRVANPRYRAPGSDRWEELDWDEAMDRIARRVKESRDRTFVERNARGQVVNRTDGIAALGSATTANEDCYLLVKAVRSLGVIYLDHQARI
ncbi:sulfate ABC transporter substrate-binding protein [Limnochorda pilosa]|uniref:Sulfate ABC transporter substrate-binding protein n=3 Tax=Limnochorda pilosa TaxID=1555112 RepID=A0A0K2SKY7_LIMPI|nr:sulfate ABC transporter substrate-binding protein [Limnochorda pilosa]